MFETSGMSGKHVLMTFNPSPARTWMGPKRLIRGCLSIGKERSKEVSFETCWGEGGWIHIDLGACSLFLVTAQEAKT